MKIKVFTLNAFAKTPKGGNPAGVCLNAESLREAQMQIIAAKVGFSETAFVMPSDDADFRVRFFTPAAEVDLCGHATIATFSLMRQKGLVSDGTCTQETKAGILNININGSESIMMDQTLPRYGSDAEKELIADSLNIPVSSLMPGLPVQAVSTGLMDLVVPVSSLKELMEIEPDFEKITEISRRFGVSGYHLFTMESKGRATAHCRNFAPLYAINEEAATGTATGATASYMFRHGLLNNLDMNNLVFEQGYAMERPSEIRASLDTSDGLIERVRVGGSASGTEEIEIEF